MSAYFHTSSGNLVKKGKEKKRIPALAEKLDFHLATYLIKIRQKKTAGVHGVVSSSHCNTN